MLIIDSHVHTGNYWSEPVEVLLFQMGQHGVSNAVLVQHNGNYDNTYLLECLRRYEGRFKAVGYVDAYASDKLKVLEDFHRQGGAGIRMNLRQADEWDPENSLFKAVGELGMIVSVIGKAADFASARFKKLLDNCPNTRFCIEHLARSPSEPPYDGYKSALDCASWPTTTIKVPGIGEILERPAKLPSRFPFEHPPELYAMAKEAFGVQRMMWGSNFPPCAVKEGYRQALEGVRNLPIFQNGDDLDWVMGKSAAKLWGFPT